MAPTTTTTNAQTTTVPMAIVDHLAQLRLLTSNKGTAKVCFVRFFVEKSSCAGVLWPRVCDRIRAHADAVRSHIVRLSRKAGLSVYQRQAELWQTTKRLCGFGELLDSDCVCRMK